MKTTLSAVFLVIVASLAATGDQKEAEVQDAHYCEMVALHKESGGEYGWPEFNGDKQC